VVGLPIFSIRATPDLADASSQTSWAIRAIEDSKRFKVKSVSTEDLTSPENKPQIIDDSSIQIAETFDDFNVMELAYVARQDNVNTENPKYAPLKVLPFVNQAYSPAKIIALQGATAYKNSFDYEIDAYIPNVASGTNGEYVNLVDGNIVIDLVKINEERVEVDFLTFENVFDDTIYT
jgi:hypothetical protein